ncbi:ATP-binding protein [Marivirga tractuosa]|uniref:ATP-binding protein n=1 Tax=Marivirga tractuosa TaxID=1006 RepID=UPI0035D04619
MFSSRIKVFIVLLIIGISSFSLLYWSYLNYVNINESIKVIAEPNDKSNKVNKVFQEIIEADNFFHTFILTDDSNMLNSYHEKMQIVKSHIQSLESDFLNDSVQLKNLDSLNRIVEEKSEYLNIILRLKKEQSNAFFTSEALKRIGRQLQDSAFIEKALLRKERLVASLDSVERQEIIRKPDDFKGINGFFRKLFGKPNIEVDTIRTIEEQIDYSLELSIDTSIVRDYFVDTTLIAVKAILLDVLTEEIDLQYQLNDAELKLYEQDQKLIDNIKIIVGEILEQERTKNERNSVIVLEETNQATQRIFIIGGVGILLSAIFLFLISQDITKANQLRKNLQLQKERALNLAQAKEGFLAKMSHEIRTPLHNIMGFTHLLSKAEMRDNEKEYIAAISQSNRYLSELIDNILEKSKIDAGNFKIEKTAVHIPYLANELHQVFKYKFLEKSLQFEIEVDDKLKENSVWVDSLKLKQVLINLIGNAVKFTESGYVKIIFYLESLNESKQELHIVVEDTGKGITDIEKELVFKQFEQGEHAKSSSLTGSGLGLTISKDIIEAFGGEIKVESVPEAGTRFHLFFPVHIDSGIEKVEQQGEVYSNEISNGKYDIHLLLVEDDPWNAKLMINILKDCVYDFKVCINAEEALDYLKSTKKEVDFIMTDISLPGMNGVQFFKLIRKLGYEMPVAAVTAHVLKNKEGEVLSKGFSDVIIKPFKPIDILSLLGQYFNKVEVVKTEKTPKYQGLWAFAGKDQANYDKLLSDFKQSLDEKLKGFEQAISQKDAENLSTLAHQMKSAFEQINLEDYSEIFQSIEVYVGLNNYERAFEEAESLLPKLKQVVEGIE